MPLDDRQQFARGPASSWDYFVASTPLWFYVLKEAEIGGQGLRLGPVGSRLVAEVFVGLLESDPDSYLNEQPDFVPTLGATSGQFRMIDLFDVRRRRRAAPIACSRPTGESVTSSSEKVSHC